jgi:hypothetical protein
MNTQINEEVQRRILGAADALYSDDSTSFPTVDSVRRRARANMADTVSVMRDWRRGKSPTQSSVTADVPEKLLDITRQLMTQLWIEAQAAANENLRTAHLGWELERQEAEAVRQQVAAAFDDQSVELDLAAQRINALEINCQAASEQVSALQVQTDNLRQQQAIAAAAHDATLQQFKQRIADLKFAVSQSRASAGGAAQKKTTTTSGSATRSRENGQAPSSKNSSSRIGGRKNVSA